MTDSLTLQSSCAHCSQMFIAPRRDARYCTPLCSHRAKFERAKLSGKYERQKAQKRETYRNTPRIPSVRPPNPRRQCAETDCARNAHGYGRCKMHYKRWKRQQGTYVYPPSEQWNDARRIRKDQRRALERGANGSERVDRQVVFERDAWMCRLCMRPTNRHADFPDPDYPTLDHIIPLARGGPHTYGNVQTACFRCNASKGDRLA